MGLPWAAPAQVLRLSSFRALQQRAGGGGVVTEQNTTDVLDIRRRFLDAASSVTDSFHESDVKSLIKELPQFRYDSLLADVAEQS